jgi:hypothetical protein
MDRIKILEYIDALLGFQSKPVDKVILDHDLVSVIMVRALKILVILVCGINDFIRTFSSNMNGTPLFKTLRRALLNTFWTMITTKCANQ